MEEEKDSGRGTEKGKNGKRKKKKAGEGNREGCGINAEERRGRRGRRKKKKQWEKNRGRGAKGEVGRKRGERDSKIGRGEATGMVKDTSIEREKNNKQRHAVSGHVPPSKLTSLFWGTSF